MKCKSCHKFLKDFYYRIGSQEFCKSCALELISDIADFKVNIQQKGGKNGNQIKNSRE